MTTRSPASPERSPDLPALLPGLLLADPYADDAGRRVRRSPRDWFVDVAAFVLAIVIGLIAFESAHANGASEPVITLDLLLGGLSCLSLWWRRRWPVELAVALAPISVFASSSGGAAAILVFTVAVHRRFADTAAVSTLHIAAGFVFYLFNPDPDMSWTGSAVFTVLFVVAITAWGMFVRARRQLVLSLRERAHQAESEAALRVERARHLERERIAREMHDVLAHRISLLSVHAGALEYRPGAPQEDIVRAASVIRASAHQALQDLREIIGVLRAPAADGDSAHRPQPTLDQLPALIQECRQAGMRLDVVDDREGDGQPPPAVARCAYRVVQEGLTNARKHARGTKVDVTLDGRAGDELGIEIRNRLPLGSATRSEIPGTGTGLIGLGERVGLAGGRLEHEITSDGEFRVFARLPWPA